MFQKAFCKAKAAYRARPQWAGALSALADALLAHGTAGRAKAREVLLKLAGISPAAAVGRLAALEDDAGAAMLAWAVGAAPEDAAEMAIVARGALAPRGDLWLQLARAHILQGQPADALRAEQAAQARGWPGERERRAAACMLAGEEDEEDAEQGPIAPGPVRPKNAFFVYL